MKALVKSIVHLGYVITGDNVVGIEYIAAGIQEYAGEYIRWRDQPPPSQETVRYQIARLAEMIERYLQAPSNEAELLAWVDCMVPDARDALCSRLKVLPCDLVTEIVKGTLSWKMVLESTCSVLAVRQKGDIKDPHIPTAVQMLVDLYEEATGKPATWSSKPNGAYGIDGGIQRIGQTPCACFVHAFFQVVDAEIAHTRIDNYMRSLLARRRRKRAQKSA